MDADTGAHPSARLGDPDRRGVALGESTAEPDVADSDGAVHRLFQGELGCGFVLASPWIFYQLWMFVATGLYPHEKRLVHVNYL